MRTVLFFVFVFFVVPVFGQNADSLAAAAQVDSLIKASRDFTAKKDFDTALEVNAAAEKIALEKLGRESAAYGSCCFNRGRVFYFEKDYPEAEKWYLESKAIREKVLGKNHPDYAASLNNLAALHSNIRQYEKAEPYYLESKAIKEKALGRDHPDYAQSLNNLANLYNNMGRYEKAEPLFLEAQAILEKAKGRDHPDFATSIFGLAYVYILQDNHRKAEPLCEEVKSIREKALGKEHPDYRKSLNMLANTKYMLSKFEESLQIHLESKAIIEKSQGKENEDYARCLNNIALVKRSMGAYAEAVSLYLESKAIMEIIGNKEDPDYASLLDNLANTTKALGDLEAAEQYYLDAMAIREKIFGNTHPVYARSLIGLGLLYTQLGQAEKAESLLLEGKTIIEKTLGKAHVHYSLTLGNLAILYTSLGQFDKAVQLNLESLDLCEKSWGKQTVQYAFILTNLANNYSQTGQFEKAEQLHLEGLDILEKVVGKESLEYAHSLTNLANQYLELRQAEKAERLFREAMVITEKIAGKDHKEYAFILLNLGLLMTANGQYTTAEEYCTKSRTIYFNTLGNQHPYYSETLKALATICEYQKQYSASERLQAEDHEIERMRLSKSLSFLSERELANFVANFQENWGFLGSFLLARTVGKASKPSDGRTGNLPALAFDYTLFDKGFLLNATARLNTLSASSPEAREIYQQLKSYRRRLAVEYGKPIAERTNVAEVEEKANVAEKELARSVAGYAEAMRQVKWQELRTALKQGEAAIEFIHFKVRFPQVVLNTMYGALVLHPGLKQPVFVPLFDEKQLAELLSKNLQDQNFAQVYAGRGATPLKTAGELHGLYDLLWRPLEKHLKGIKTVFYAPSGLLHRINFDAIPLENKQTLSDHFRLVRLSSSRSLVVPDLTKTDTTNAAMLFGGIQYDSDTTATLLANTGLDSVSIASRGELSFSYTDSTLRIGTWSALPFTDREVHSVEKMLKTAGFRAETRRGTAATEEAFKSIGAGGKPSPRVLHLATHGFFFPDPKLAVSSERVSGERESVFKLSDHPMIRSGLLLAGGNHAWATGKPLREGMEDGILTAYEISQMNLSNTELVVLSACETGLGDIQGNEGVYGLQRAFKIAGAKYLVMSLWQVDDQATMKFMEVFYRKWLVDKMPIPDAFRATQAEMRERFLNPYLWAGFVLVE